jgi:hypothetical protein
MQRALCLLMLLLATACGDDSTERADGEGSVAFTTWGEEFIEDEIPASDDGGFVDGWTVVYDRFLVNIGGVEIADGDEVGAEAPGFTLFDQAATGVKHLVTFDDVPAKAWPEVSYEIRRVTSDSGLGPEVSAADRDLMKQHGYSVFVEGTASNGDETKRFAWGFDKPTRYGACKGEEDGVEREGLVVKKNAEVDIQLTIHGDHPFYDRLQESPNTAVQTSLRFDALAEADADEDGEVTLVELDGAVLDVTRYDPSPFEVTTLGEFMGELIRTIGHYRGEGECSISEL